MTAGWETQGASATSVSSCCFKQIAPTFYPAAALRSSLVLTGPEAAAGGPARPLQSPSIEIYLGCLQSAAN